MAISDRRGEWFDIWYDDRQSIIQTMIKNMVSDLECGYDYFGESIVKQREMIEDYQSEFDYNMKTFQYMEDKEVDRWCYYDLKRRGAIE